MKLIKNTRSLFLLFTCLASTLVLGAEKDDGFVSIFDGKTLAGWKPVSTDAKDAWVVRDGVIRGDGDKGGRCYLAYEENKKIGNFELKFSYRLTGSKANSGVSIRAVEDKTGRRDFQSYHADLGAVGMGKQVMGAWDFHTPGRKEHRCFRGDRLVIDKNDKPTITPIENGLKEEDIKKGDWNAVHLIARGNQFRFIINGKTSAEFTEHLPKEKRLHSGMIQLQLHNPKMIAEFKDLDLKILD
jgi:hypothetical protein